MKNIQKHYDFVVIGGGMAGLCAAIAAARHGAKTALVHDRPVLGGNASSEIRMHISGANFMGRRADARETGIVCEILEENRGRNPGQSWAVWDMLVWEKAHLQENLDLFLNTHCTDVATNGNKITRVTARQLTSETTIELSAKLFLDSTGDGTVGFLAGAEYMTGREGKDVFGESLAPEKSEKYTMGNTLLFKTVDTGKPIEFVKPSWANTYSEDDLRLRDHGELSGGYWWIELGGKDLDIIDDAEEIRDELMKALYGIWDHLKNGGPDGTDHGAANLDLEWAGFLPGKRESRRFVGDYVLKQDDALDGCRFDDAVAYGGWSLDDHIVGGLQTTDQEPATVVMEAYIPKDVFAIPYRSLYSKNIENLFIGGRSISVSHVALGGVRQMGQTAIMGQAVGTAAAIALEHGTTPRGVGKHIGELQQALLRDDCYIPGVENEEPNDLARNATVTASSHRIGGEPANVINGTARKVKENENAWISEPIGGSGGAAQWLDLKLAGPANVREIDLRFDSNLTQSLPITISQSAYKKYGEGIPPNLVKDYDIELLSGESVVHTEEIRGNYLRHRRHVLTESTDCTALRITVHATRGVAEARIFEVRIYGK